MRKRKGGGAPPLEFVAGNGLMHRRALLQSGVMFAGALGSGATLTSAAAEPLTEPEWSLYPGAVTPVLQTPSKYEKDVVRTLSNPKGDARTQHARAPLQKLNGTITPNALHFTINHSGIPDIDPDKHVLVIHGMVREPLEFTIDALMRYPMVTRKHFVECGGNSAPMFSPEPIQAPLQALHGLVSCAEWTGVPVSTLLDEAGVDPKATWMLAEGADSLAVSRSVPLKKAYDDAIVALYQNGERIMPGNGYPMRLLLPGYEGNMNTKFLRRLKVVDQPAMTYYESRNYSPLRQGLQVLLRQRGKILHHPAVVRLHHERPGLLRDFRHRLFRHRTHRESFGLRRRRQELGRSCGGRPGQPEGVHALLDAVALGRPAGDHHQPRLGRFRRHAAAARRLHRGARRGQESAERARLSQPAL